ncbi:glutathione S-transferase 3-like [Watersipora subatra]|uniref:glutathione S-transferase 3-like n=1 Tax=Watersipora subatra TaxID=2589382 RepID=UPI00355B0DF9
MASLDKLTYFGAHARAGPIRMLYALAGVRLEDHIVKHEEWIPVKAALPLGQVPVFKCEEGRLLMSKAIVRYVAKKFGFVGATSWDEAMNDMLVEVCSDCFEDINQKVYFWMLFERFPKPDDADKVKENIKANIIKSMNFIEAVAKKRGKNFILDDKISLADVWLYSFLEFGLVAFPELMDVTPWIREFVEKFKNEARVKTYLAVRRPSHLKI